MNSSSNILRRRRWLIGVAMLGLALYAVTSYFHAARAADRLALAQMDRDETADKLADIGRLKTVPKVAALQLEAPAEIINRISAARKTAGLPQSSLLQQQPMEPQRIGRTDFLQRSTTIKLAPSTMVAILKFCEALRDEQTGTIVRDLRLTQPEARQRAQQRGGEQEKWGVEMTLTQMIFSPKNK